MLFRSLYGHHLISLRETASMDVDTSLSLFSLEPWRLIREFKLPYPVSHVAFSLSTGLLVTATTELSRTRLDIHALDVNGIRPFASETLAGPISGLALAVPGADPLSAPAYVVAAAEGAVYVYRLPRGGTGGPSLLHRLPTGVLGTPFGQDSVAVSVPRLVYQAEPGDVRVVDLMSGAEIGAVKAHTRGAARLALSPDGNTLAAISLHGTIVRLYDVGATAAAGRDAPLLAPLTPLRRGSRAADVSTLGFSRDSRVYFVGSDHGSLHIAPVPDPAGPTGTARRAAAICAVPEGSVGGAVIIGRRPGAGGPFSVLVAASKAATARLFTVPAGTVTGPDTSPVTLIHINTLDLAPISAIAGDWNDSSDI